MEFDSNLLSRIQFAFTISFHIIFPSFTIGLASWLAVIEGLWIKTGNNVYQEIYKFWIKVFAITFAMGVVSGVVMSYQFGTNWSSFSDKIGNILGPLLAFEVLTAFFLESSFLGVMLFGWNKVSKKMHFAATVIVAIGTIISAFWIIAANSWMQTPTGFEVRADNVFYPVNWLKIIFNPSFPYRFCHMIIASYLTTAFVISGVSAWYLLHKQFINHAKIMFEMAMLMTVFVAPVQFIIGDQHGLNTLKYQPAKISAMEGIWDTKKGAAFKLFGWPSVQEETTRYSIELPKCASLLLTHSLDGEIQGLKEWPKRNRPPVLVVFLAFRIMVGIAILMLTTGIIASVLYLRKRLFDTRWFQYWCMLMTPAGFVAILAGWFVTEIGRQPYVVYNILRTSEVSSPILGQYIFTSLMAFIIVYTFVFGGGIYYIIYLIRKGPSTINNKKTYDFII